MKFSLKIRYLISHFLDCPQTCKYFSRVIPGVYYIFVTFTIFSGSKANLQMYISPKNELFL